MLVSTIQDLWGILTDVRLQCRNASCIRNRCSRIDNWRCSRSQCDIDTVRFPTEWSFDAIVDGRSFVAVSTEITCTCDFTPATIRNRGM